MRFNGLKKRMTLIWAVVFLVLLVFGVVLIMQTSGQQADFLTAAGKNDVTAVRHYLDNGGDPNVRGSQGETALLQAAASGSLDVMNELLGRGADVNLPDLKGRTPLQAAKENGKTECAQLLEQHGASK